jgi:hypothetical protein
VNPTFVIDSPLIKPDFIFNIKTDATQKKNYNLKAGFYILKLDIQTILGQKDQRERFLTIFWNGKIVDNLKLQS